MPPEDFRFTPPSCIALVAVLVFAVVQAATLRAGTGWGDDFAMYVLQARNLAERRPYEDTGYIHNPNYPELGPRAYPPGYPLLLSPVYKAFGRDMTAFKIEQCVFLLLGVIVVAALLASELPPVAAFAGVAAFAFNPYVAASKNYISSDLAFLLFSGLVFLLARQVDGAWATPSASRTRRWIWPLLLGLDVYIAIACRTIGIVWLIVLPVCDLVRFRRLRRPVLVALAVTVALAVWQTLLLSARELSYVQQLRSDFGYVFVNVKEYGLSMVQFWPSGIRALNRVLLLLLDALALYGFVKRARFGIELPEVFTVLYLGAVALWPTAEPPRLLIPILPTYILYIATALVDITARLDPGRKRLVWAVPTLLLTAYVMAFARVPRGPMLGPEEPQAQEMFGFVRRATPPDAVFIFRKPRAFALYGERRASAYHEAESDAALWVYFHEIGASYLVVDKGLPPDAKDSDDMRYARYIERFAARQTAKLQLVYDNDAFRVFQLRMADKE